MVLPSNRIDVDNGEATRRQLHVFNSGPSMLLELNCKLFTVLDNCKYVKNYFLFRI